MMKSKRLLLLLLMALIAPLAMHAQQSLPYYYGFEDGNLATDGWETQNTVTTYTHIYSASTFSATAHDGGTYLFGFPYSEENGAYLVSPLFTGGDQGINVTFYYRCYYSSYPETFQVGYTTDETVTDASAFTYGNEITTSSTVWEEYSNSFPAGTKRIAIKYIYTDAYYLLLDDFSFEVPTSCAKPQNLVVGTIGKRSVTLSWDEMGDTREWQVCLNGDESNPISANSNDNFVLDGLDPETTYTVKVRSYCSADSQSNWTAEQSFTTLEACPAPTVTVTPTPTSATVTCTSDASSYNLRYAMPDPTQPATIILTVGDVWGDGSGYQMLLDADATAYGTIIPETGGLTSSGDASAETYAEFEYKIPVNADGALTTENIVINNSISIQIPAGTYDWCITNPTPGDRMWIASSAGSVDGRQDDYEFLGGFVYEFVVSLGESGNDRVDLTLGYNGPWIEEVTEVTSPVTLPVYGDPLTPETQYIVQVQALCGGEDGSSNWTTVFFTTPSSCDAPIELAAEATATEATLEWTGYQESYNIQYRTAGFDGYYINEPLTPGNIGDWSTYLADDYSSFYYTDDTQTDIYWKFSYNTNPPQYLFSPDFPRPTQQSETLTFDYKVGSDSYPETFQLFYFVGEDLVEEDAVTVTNTDWEQYTSQVPVGATSFVIAYLSNDMFALYLDNFVIYAEDEITEAGPWMTTTATETTATLTGLESETEYEWQVQGVNASCDGGLTDWSASAYFTTLPAADEVTQTVELVEGWNWFSTYIELEDPIELLEMLEEGLGESGIQIESVVDGVNMNAGEEWAGDLMSIGLMNEHTYMIEVNADVTVELQGPATNPADHPITIYPGEYSWIGFPCAEEVDVNVALAGFEAEEGDMIETVFGEEGGIIYYYGGVWVGDFDTMVPGRGYIYFYNGTDEQTLVFQTEGEAKAKRANTLNENNILKDKAKKISKIKMNPNLSNSKMESKAPQLAKSKYCNEIKQLKLFKK